MPGLPEHLTQKICWSVIRWIISSQFSSQISTKTNAEDPEDEPVGTSLENCELLPVHKKANKHYWKTKLVHSYLWKCIECNWTLPFLFVYIFSGKLHFFKRGHFSWLRLEKNLNLQRRQSKREREWITGYSLTQEVSEMCVGVCELL